MEHLNDPCNDIYIRALDRTKNIDKKLEKTRMNCLTNNVELRGSKNDILFHLKGGPTKNLINSFFPTTHKCDNCGKEKNKSIQLDRAHCNKHNCDRSSLLKQSIEIHYVNEETPIMIKDILKTFIKLHAEIPLFILCKECHRKYDK